MVLLLVTPEKETRGDRTKQHSEGMSVHWGKISELLGTTQNTPSANIY